MLRKDHIVFMFSGQGSHYRGMGQKMYQANPVFKKSLDRSEEIIRRLTGMSLLDELYNGDDSVFDIVLITHPAIVAVELAMIEVMQDLGVIPDAVIGVSLGEFAAAAAAGYLTPEEALTTAIEQAKIVIQHVEEGGMTVLMNNKTPEIKQFIEAHALNADSRNFQNCYTISGRRPDMDRLDEMLAGNGSLFQRLAVEFPFHSAHMETAALFWQYQNSTTVYGKGNGIPMYSCLTGDRLGSMPQNHLWDVVSGIYDFPATLKVLEKDFGANALYLDLGPSGTMANYVKYSLGITPADPAAGRVKAFLSLHHQCVERLEAFREQIETGTSLLRM